jgi:oxygen-independent coproporphyrinogen-3 oxidase
MGDKARGEAAPAIAHYVAALCQEIQLQGKLTQYPQPLQTIFFGGGTPSLLDPSQIATILQQLQQIWGWAEEIEISLEVDPGTFTQEQLKDYRAAGVNRLSLGVQSFVPDLLAAMGRTHQVEDIAIAVTNLKAAGFTNWSLDLISGLPGQTDQQWQTSLQAAIELQPTHVSCYDLVLEPGTVFGKRYQPGDAPLPSDDLAAEMYRIASSTLTAAGYQHYEISNYAHPGYQCRHNQVYWRNQPYYGFGMGATSYVQHQRYSRPRTRAEYYAWVEAWATTGKPPSGPATSRQDQWLETLMLGLRLAAGVSWQQLEHSFSAEWLGRLRACLQTSQASGWVVMDPVGVRLTDPEGFLYSNQVLGKIWEEFDEDVSS